jgi:hypothetical protein
VVVGALVALAVGTAVAAPRRLAVLELADEAGLEPAAVRFLGERVLGEAAALPRADWLVMTRENLLALLPPGKDLADCVGGCEVETGRNIGADVVVSGGVVRLGGELKVTLRAHETAHGALLGQEIAAASDAAALDEPVAAAARRLFARLGQPEGPRAVLHLRAPDGLEVRINGVRIGTTPIADQPLDAGSQRVELESRCHQPMRVVVDLAPGESRTLDLAPPLRRARLRAEALSPAGEPVPAEVSVDGRVLGSTPGTFDVPVCVREVEVRGGGDTWRGELALREGQVTGVTATLGAREAVREAAPAPAHASAAPAWLMLGGGVALAAGAVMALSNHKDGEKLQQDPGNRQLRDQVDASYRASLVLYAGGGLAAAIGLGWWLLSPADAVGVGATPAGVSFGGVW